MYTLFFLKYLNFEPSRFLKNRPIWAPKTSYKFLNFSLNSIVKL